MKNGVGMAILMYHDGRGFGLGNYVIAGQNGVTKSQQLDVPQVRARLTLAGAGR